MIKDRTLLEKLAEHQWEKWKIIGPDCGGFDSIYNKKYEQLDEDSKDVYRQEAREILEVINSI